MKPIPPTDTAISALGLRTPAPSSDLETLRSPVIPLPDFVTAAWLAQHIRLAARDVRLLHGNAGMFTEGLGLPWPDEKPDLQACHALLLEGLRYPYFWRHFAFAFSQVRKNRTRLLDGLFKNFAHVDRSFLNKKSSMLSMASSKFAGGRNVAEFLREESCRDLGRAMVVLGWAERRDVPPDAEEAISADPELGAYVAGLLAYKSVENDAKIEAALLAWKAGQSAEMSPEPPAAVEAVPATASRESVRGAWSAAVQRLVSRAGSSAAALPDADVAADLLGLAEELQALSATWAALPPERSPADVILDRLRPAVEGLGKLRRAIGSEEDGVPLSDVELALLAARSDAGPEACADAEASIAEAEKCLAEAGEVRDRLQALDESGLSYFARSKEQNDLVPRGGQAIEAGLRAALDAARRLASEPAAQAAPVAVEPTDPERHPIAAQAPGTPPVLLEARSDPLPAIEPAAPPVEEEDEITRGLDRLVMAGAFGAAHHLRCAADHLGRGIGTSTWSAAELHLAAVAGRLDSAGERDVDAWHTAMLDGVDVAQALEDAPQGDRTGARRVVLLASVLPAALFPGAEERLARAIIDRVGLGGRCSPFFKLVDALDENQRHDYPLNRTTLRETQATARARATSEQLKEALRSQIHVMRHNRSEVEFEGKIKAWLHGAKGLVGQLETGLDGPDPIAAARAFVAEIGTRDGAIAAIEAARREVQHGHHAPLDGALRNALVKSLLKLSELCRDFVAASTAPRPRSAPVEAEAHRIRERIREALDHACASEPVTGDPLLAAAFAHARTVLGRIRALIDGSEEEEDPLAAAMALHGPLLHLGGVFRNAGWRPSTTQAETILPEILAARPEDLVPDREDTSGFAEVLKARQSEGAFVAAHLLLALAGRFGVASERIECLASALLAEEDIRRDQLRRRQEEAGRLIDRVRRAASASFEATERLQSRLKVVRPERLPVRIDPVEMPERAEDRIDDFNAAQSFIADLETEARALLEREKSALGNRIAALPALPDDARRALEKLRDADDLVTLSDWLRMFEGPEAERPVLGPGVLNHRLEAFLDRLETLSGIEIRAARDALAEGRDYLGFALSALEPGRQREALSILERWIALKREAIAGDASARSVAGPLTDLLTTMIGRARLLEVDPFTVREQGVYALDIAMTVAAGPGSLLLPDFGSAIRGRWRVVVRTTVPAAAEIVRHASGTGEDRGVIVVVLGMLTRDRRRSLKVECVKSACKVLVLDEALLLEALGDPEPTPLAALEIAQGFTVAAPYRDYANRPVPPEMFKGRLKEQGEIVRPHGSAIVYGGRRLGKTALLRHIERQAPRSGAVYRRIDLGNLIASDDIWERLSSSLGEVFGGALRTAEAFERRIRDWLDEDRDNRRILLMLDEADNFIHDQGESHGWRHLRTLIALMDSTGERFKIVLAGLHNLSRIARGDDQPLARLSAGALEIGPLSGAEAGDAEALVRTPLAAMGYEFERREDVWRILSATLYYPVLIQIFCRELLRLIHERIRTTNEPLWKIGTGLVEAALASRDIRERLGETFEKTIRNIEGRYELLTCLLVRDAVFRETASTEREGLLLGEIAEAASRCWPAAFPDGPDSLETARLLDEMRGFGLVRRTEGAPGDRWALRSRMLLDLMADADAETIEARLARFARRPFEPQFDPPNLRRLLRSGPRGKQPSPTSPLTENDLAVILRPGRKRAVLVFGPPIADLDAVPATLDAARTAGIGFRKASSTRKSGLLSTLGKSRGDALAVVAIGPEIAWRPDWVEAALDVPAVAEGRVRPVFIGGPEHAVAYAAEETPLAGCIGARVLTLRPWTRSCLSARLDAILDGFAPELLDEILAATGGWNAPCSALLAEGEPPDSERLARCKDKLRGSDMPRRLGVPSDRPEIAAVLEDAAGPTPSFDRAADFDAFCELLTPPADPGFIRRYGVLMGLFRIDAPGVIRVNPLAAAVFGVQREAVS